MAVGEGAGLMAVGDADGVSGGRGGFAGTAPEERPEDGSVAGVEPVSGDCTGEMP